MTSGKKARQHRRTPPPPVRSTGGRQASPKVLLIAAAVILLVGGAAAAGIALTRGSSSSASGPAATLPDSASVLAEYKGIPQHGTTLGSPNAPVQLIQYIDLQCPICREFETTVMPSIVPKYVRTGKVQVVSRPLAFINPAANSQRGRLAALAAGKQNRFYDFAQLTYANQGQEGTDWLTDGFVSSVYASIPGLDTQAAQSARTSSLVSSQAQTSDHQANADKVSGTPTILVGKRGGPYTFVGPGAPSVQTLEAAIKHALGQ
jgi:protein-disulfide isomerase